MTQLARSSLAMLFTTLIATQVSAAPITIARADAFAADPVLNDGDTTTVGTVGGVTWSFDSSRRWTSRSTTRPCS